MPRHTLYLLSVQIRSPDNMTRVKYNKYYPSKIYLNSFILCIILREQIEYKLSIDVYFHFLFLSLVSFLFILSFLIPFLPVFGSLCLWKPDFYLGSSTSTPLPLLLCLMAGWRSLSVYKTLPSGVWGAFTATSAWVSARVPPFSSLIFLHVFFINLRCFFIFVKIPPLPPNLNS